MSSYPAAPQPGYPTGYGQGQLVVVIRQPVGSLGMISPLVTIPGQHRVRVWARYLFEYGAAEQDVDIAPGQSLEVHYSPPMLTFVRGRIGLGPQGRPGLVPLLAVLGGVVLIVVLIVLLAVLTG